MHAVVLNVEALQMVLIFFRTLYEIVLGPKQPAVHACQHQQKCAWKRHFQLPCERVSLSETLSSKSAEPFKNILPCVGFLLPWKIEHTLWYCGHTKNHILSPLDHKVAGSLGIGCVPLKWMRTISDTPKRGVVGSTISMHQQITDAFISFPLY